MSKEKHLIKFPIGDWSDDGHGKCDWYTVESNKSLGHLIDAHFEFEKIAKFSIGDMCSHYKIYHLTEAQMKFLSKIGCTSIAVMANGKMREDEDAGLIESSEYMLEIWLTCLKHADPSLVLAIRSEKEIPKMINWNVNQASRKNKKKYLRGPGYGLFS